MKKNIKLYILHPFVHNLDEMLEYINADKELYHYIWDEENPDYLVISEHIYKKRYYYKKFLKYLEREKEIIIIYLAGECIAPDMNLFDYAIVFDRKLKDGDRICRMPAMIFHKNSVFETENNITYENARHLLREKTGFCNFLYSNSNAHPFRDQLFFALSEYAKVDSLGGHLNNMPVIRSRGTYDWGKGGINIKKNYKFSIAAENAQYEGYVTEKLLTSLQAHSIPIYWGDPDVEMEFNPKAIINCNKLGSLEKVIVEVKKINESDEMWCKMISEPWQTSEQLAVQNKELKEYREFLNNIFSKEKIQAKRLAEGTYPSVYRNWYKKRFRMTINEFYYKVKHKLQKHI